MISKGHFYNCMPSYKYCDFPEQIENYDLAIVDETQVWSCHHKLEAFFSKRELINIGRYYHLQPRDLVFVKEKGKQVDKTCHYFWPHVARKNKGKVSEETKNKMSKSHKGKKGFTNGIINVFDFVCPPGFWPGITHHK